MYVRKSIICKVIILKSKCLHLTETIWEKPHHQTKDHQPLLKVLTKHDNNTYRLVPIECQQKPVGISWIVETRQRIVYSRSWSWSSEDMHHCSAWRVQSRWRWAAWHRQQARKGIASFKISRRSWSIRGHLPFKTGTGGGREEPQIRGDALPGKHIALRWGAGNDERDWSSK